jgi:hypothetical protein
MKRIGPSCVLLSIALILTGCRWGYSYSEFGYRMDRFLQTEESRDEKTPLADETSEEQEMKQSQT